MVGQSLPEAPVQGVEEWGDTTALAPEVLITITVAAPPGTVHSMLALVTHPVVDGPHPGPMLLLAGLHRGPRLGPRPGPMLGPAGPHHDLSLGPAGLRFDIHDPADLQDPGPLPAGPLHPDLLIEDPLCLGLLSGEVLYLGPQAGGALCPVPPSEGAPCPDHLYAGVQCPDHPSEGVPCLGLPSGEAPCLGLPTGGVQHPGPQSGGHHCAGHPSGDLHRGDPLAGGHRGEAEPHPGGRGHLAALPLLGHAKENTSTVGVGVEMSGKVQWEWGQSDGVQGTTPKCHQIPTTALDDQRRRSKSMQTLPSVTQSWPGGKSRRVGTLGTPLPRPRLGTPPGG